jgi:predicted metal-dependent phosphoesterase TrpH
MFGTSRPRHRSPLHLVFLAAASCAALFNAEALAQESPEGAPRWWKGNIHTHSLWSDGNDFPEMIADWYRSHGYHFLALSDHNVLSEGTRWMKHDEVVKRGGKDALEKYIKRFGDDWVETQGTPGSPDFEVRLQPLDRFRKLLEEPGQFIMIQGEEISDTAEGVPVHMNATNVAELIQPLGGRTVAEAIDNNLRAAEEQARRTGREILVHLNHPNFGYAITAEDIAAVLRERFVEVYNGHNVINHLGNNERASVEQIWDIANTIRLGQLGAPPLFGVGTDDSHNYHSPGGARPGRGWTWVRAAKLEPESLIQAMKAGDLYASSGVTLRNVRYNADKRILQIEIEPSQGIQYTTQFIGTKIGYDANSEPRTDKDGKPLRTTRRYSADVGQVFATVEGASPSYQLTGQELYVRAVVTSSKPHPDPSFDNQHQQAWTQPVGWQERLGEQSKRVSAAD